LSAGLVAQDVATKARAKAQATGRANCWKASGG
jgi:hypothetical protein